MMEMNKELSESGTERSQEKSLKAFYHSLYVAALKPYLTMGLWSMGAGMPHTSTLIKKLSAQTEARARINERVKIKDENVTLLLMLGLNP